MQSFWIKSMCNVQFGNINLTFNHPDTSLLPVKGRNKKKSFQGMCPKLGVGGA